MPRRSKYKNTRGSRLAKAALKMAKSNRRDIAGEIKFVDVNIGTTDVTNADTTGFVTLLSDVDQGDGVSQRIAEQIKCSSLSIKGKVEWQTGGENSSVCVIVLKKILNIDDAPIKYGTQGTETAVLQTGAANELIPLAHLQWQNRYSWKILSRDIFVGNPDSQDNLVFSKYYRLNHKVNYDADDAIVGSRQGSIYLLAYSEEPAGSTAPHLSFTSRFKYVDN